MDTIKIQGRSIGQNFPPFVIAEMSGNHKKSLERALKIVDEAAKTGAHALKLQTYTADTMTLDLAGDNFSINNPKSLWFGRSLYDLYKEAHTPWDWHKPIFERCKELGLICFSTPFDETAVDFLESLNVPAYKIASFENNHLPLIKRVAQTKKPILISTGMATITELDEAVRCARDAGCKEIILLKCTSSYPATHENANVFTIPHMRNLFGCEVGLSDHTLGIGAALASVTLGATVIEKHFTLNRSDGGVDSLFSIEPTEMKSLVDETKRAWQSLGSVSYGPTEQEKQSIIFRRSLYIVKDTKAGEKLTNENLRAIRPGYGLPPKFYEVFIGRRVKADIKKGTPVDWDIF
jgi:N-acetylneuraminate synthase